MVERGIEAGMYERTTSANGRVSAWGAQPVLVKKPGQAEPRLTFNYHYVYEEPPGSQMELADRVHSLLSIPSHKTYFQADLKHGYWAVSVHPEDRHYLAFSIPGLGQLQPTRMPQGTRTSSFTFTGLMNIALGPIPAPKPEPSLLHSGIEHKPPDLAFYLDDIFGAHASWEEQYQFLEYHFFPRFLWSRLKLSLSKLRIGMTSIKALGETHEVGGRVRIRPEKVEKILNWPKPQNASETRGFLGTAQGTRKWVRGFGNIARPLTRLTGNTEWRWTDSE